MAEPLKKPPAVPPPQDVVGLIRWVVERTTAAIATALPEHLEDIIGSAQPVLDELVHETRRESTMRGYDLSTRRDDDVATERTERWNIDPRPPGKRRLSPVIADDAYRNARPHLDALLASLNRMATIPDGALILNSCTAIVRAHDRDHRAVVAWILETEPERRDQLRGENGQRLGRGILEGLALLLIVLDMIEHGPGDGWARTVLLDGFRRRPADWPPSLRPRYPVSPGHLHFLAGLIIETPDAILKRLRRCRERTCGLVPHKKKPCQSPHPYFVDTSQAGCRVSCCDSHRANSHRRQATS